MLGVLLSLACAPALATNWDGVGAANNNWSQGLNWQGNAAPTNPNGVANFAAAGAPLASTVDVPWNLSQLSFLNFNWAVTGQTITFSNPGFIDVTGGAPTITNPIVIGGTTTITNSVPITLSSVTGFPARSLIKAGTGTLTISTFGLTGTTTINAGTLVASPANGSGASDIVVAAGATLNTNVGFWRNLSGAGTAVLVDGAFFNQSSTTTFSGNIQGSGGLNKGGTGTLILTGNNSLNNQLTLSGPIQFGDGVRVGTTPFPENGWVNGGPGTGAVVTMNLTGQANVRCMVNAVSVVVVNGTVNQTGTQLTGCPWNTSGDHTVNGGILNNTEVLSNGNFVVNFPGTWRASSGFAGSLAGNGDVTFNGEVGIGRSGADTTYSGFLSGTGSLRKQGNGKLTLTGPVNLPNPSYVDAGTVHLQNSQITPYLVVSSGATLSGSGTTFNPIEVQLNATFAPTLIDTYSVYSTGNLAFAINGTVPGSQHSRINVNAAPSLNGSTLVLSGSYVPGPGDTFVLINNNDPSNFPANGTFDGLPEGSVTLFNGAPLKITYVGGSNNNDVVLSFASHTVTSSSSGNGGISPSGAQTVSHNATRSFTLAPAPNYHIGSVTGTCGGSLAGSTFTTNAVTGNCTVIANFAPDTYLVTPSAGANGTISPSTAQSVAHGSTQAFTVTPSTGYDAAVGGTCPAGTLTGTTYTTGVITGPCTVAATFTLKQYTVTPSAGANGAISPATAQTVNHGATLQFTVTPNTGYAPTMGGSCPAGSLVGTTYTTGAITGNCTVSATFALKSYTVTPSAGANGTISPTAPQSASHGSTLQFTVTANSGYTASVGGTCPAGSLAGSTYTTGAIVGDCTVSATFTLNSYTVTPGAGANGAISPATPQPVSHGATRQFTVTPNTGYDTAAVGGTCPAGSLVGNTYTTGPITADCTVTASFQIKNYTVTPSAGANGTISPATPQTLAHGATTAFTVTPAANYSATVGGSCGGTLSGNTYTTSAITGDCTVSATFVPALTTYNIVLEGWQVVNPYALTPASGGGTATFNAVTKQLTFNLAYSGLTASEIGSRIDAAARGANGLTVATLSTGSPKNDVLTLDASLESMLLAGELAVVVRTSAFPNGELRGQIDNLGATVLRTLTVSKAGAGGFVIGQVPGSGQVISCGLDCSEQVPQGTVVELFAQGDPGVNVSGWSAPCSGSDKDCSITMDTNKSVTVTFGTIGADLSTALSATPNPAAVGQEVVFTMTIYNGGPEEGREVLGEMRLPAGMTFVAATSGCAFDAGTRFVLCDAGNQAVGSTRSFNVVVRPTTTGTFAFTSDVSSSRPDWSAGNETSTVNLVVDAGSRLTGISTRMAVLTGDNVLIGGLVIEGAAPKMVVIRARGPSLGVAGALQNPTLTLVPAAGPAVTNDDWQTAANAVQLQASGFAPADPRESAILIRLDPGAYTAIVSGVGNTTGVAIVEVYEIDQPESALIAISTRGLVQTGDNVMIGGFIIQGNTPQTVVVRARGPSVGVAGALQNPMLTLVPASGPAIVNDDWQSAANAAQLQASGFAPSNALESAILITLAPGAYTAIVSGVGGTTGVAIVEVYALD